MADNSIEYVEYIRDLRELIYNGRYVGVFKGKYGQISGELRRTYADDLKFYEKKYARELAADAHNQYVDRMDFLKRRALLDSLKAKAKSVASKLIPSNVKNVDDLRIQEIEQKYTRPSFEGFFPTEDFSHRLSKNSFAVFDTEVDDKGKILTINATKVRYDYTTGQLVRLSTPDADWGRTYTPQGIDVRNTESVHKLNPKILEAMRKASGAKYSSNWNKQQRQEFLEWVGSSVLVGHNIEDADIPWLYEKGMNSQWRGFKGSFFDTVHLARGFWKGQKNDLEALSERLGVPFSSIPGLTHHDVMSDVVVTAKVFEKLVQQYAPIRNALDLDKFQTMHYDDVRVFNGASGFFKKPNGGYIMEKDIDDYTADDWAELMDARQEFDSGVGVDAEGNNTGFGYTQDAVKEYINHRIGDRLKIIGTTTTERVNEEYRYVNEAAKHFKAGKTYAEVLQLMDGAYHLTGSPHGYMARALSIAGKRRDMVEPLQSKLQREWDIYQQIGIHDLGTAARSKARREAYERNKLERAQAQAAALTAAHDAYYAGSREQRIYSGLSIGQHDENAWRARREAYEQQRRTREQATAQLIGYQAGRIGIGQHDENAWRARRDAFYQQRSAQNAALLNKYSSNLRMEDRIALGKMIDHTNVDKFAESLAKLTRNMESAQKTTETFGDKIVRGMGSMKGPGWYDWTQIGDTRIAGTNAIQHATLGLVPSFMRAPFARMYEANIQRMQAQQAIWNNRYNNVRNVIGLGTSFLGGFGGAGGAGAGGSGGSGVMNGLGALGQLGTQLVGGTVNAHITKANLETAAKINYLGAAVQAVMIPLRLFRTGLHASVNLFKQLGNVWGTQYGMPLTFLTSMHSPAYSAMLQGDRFFGMQSGMLNSMHNNFSLAQAGLYTSGRFDTNRLVAAARLGVFTEAYAPMGGNRQAQFATMVNKLSARMAGASDAEQQQMMFLMNDLDPNMMNIVQRLSNYRKYLGKSMRFEDYQSGAAWGNTIWRREFTDYENANWEWTAGEWGAARQQMNYGIKRLATPLWSAFGRPVMNTLNKSLSALEGAESFDDVKTIASNAWSEIRGELHLDELMEKIKGAWSGGISAAVITALQTGAAWLHEHKDDLADIVVPIIAKFKSFLNDIGFDPIHGVYSKSERAAEDVQKRKFWQPSWDSAWKTTEWYAGGEISHGVGIGAGMITEGARRILQEGVPQDLEGDPANVLNYMRNALVKQGHMDAANSLYIMGKAFNKFYNGSQQIYNNTLGATIAEVDAVAGVLASGATNLLPATGATAFKGVDGNVEIKVTLDKGLEGSNVNAQNVLQKTSTNKSMTFSYGAYKTQAEARAAWSGGR